MNKAPRICLLAAGHVASCPRLVKEADTLSAQGYEVLIIARQNLAKISKIDLSIQKSSSWKLHNIQWTVMNRLMNKFSSQHALTSFLNGEEQYETLCQALAPWSKAALQQIRIFKPSLIIAHTLPSLAIAARAKELFNIPFAFDMEDYHPGEGEDEIRNQTALRILRMTLPQAVFITSASPFIATQTEREFGLAKVTTILNCFPLVKIPVVTRIPSQLSLYWFSQTLGMDRGLNDVFTALSKVNGNFQLHLRGMVSRAVKSGILRECKLHGIDMNLYFHDWCPASEMVSNMAPYDVGLAVERTQPLNKNLTISNKMLYYPVAGLAVAATRTRGQEWVMQQVPEMGFLYEPGDTDALAIQFQHWIDHPMALIQAKMAARRAAEEMFCWEKEAPIFLDLVANHFSQ